jgi:hypothetical protein
MYVPDKLCPVGLRITCIHVHKTLPEVPEIPLTCVVVSADVCSVHIHAVHALIHGSVVV